ncbi:MAG: class I SAM-dependent methyltransferase [Pyrinomonadaceae bacterium]
MTDEEKLSYDERRARTRELAAEFNEKGEPLGWFDALYKEADGDSEKVPWADMEPNRFFREWAESKGLKGDGRSALVVGCGLGDDAKYLDDLGFNVTAFDLSPTAIEWAKKVYGDSDIRFETADLFDPPREWIWQKEKPPAAAGGFDFVLEIYTIQPLPLEMRSKVIDSIAAFVAPGGRLVVVTRGREDGEDVDIVPWPLSREELARFGENGLTEESFDDIWDAEDEQRRFVIEYRRR